MAFSRQRWYIVVPGIDISGTIIPNGFRYFHIVVNTFCSYVTHYNYCVLLLQLCRKTFSKGRGTVFRINPVKAKPKTLHPLVPEIAGWFIFIMWIRHPSSSSSSTSSIRFGRWASYKQCWSDRVMPEINHSMFEYTSLKYYSTEMFFLFPRSFIVI